MGIQMTKICPTESIGFEDLEGKTVAVDASNSLYAFLSIIRDRFTGEPLKDSNGRVTSHLSGLFYRTSKMVKAGMKPVYVFDGEPPEFKERTAESRRKTKEKARKKLKKARKKGDKKAIRKYAQATSKMTGPMFDEAKKVLDAMGVPHIQAPSEAEAQCARVVMDNKAWCVGSNDYDSLLFGAERLLRNLSVTGKRKLPGKQAYVDVEPSMIELKALLNKLKLDRKQLIMVGILIGTDYNPGGIKGIGPKRALDLVRDKKTLDAVFKEVEWKFDPSPQKIFDFFMHPPVKEDYSLKSGRPDPDGIRKILCEEHGFSEDRIQKSLDALVENASQGSLDNWL